MQFLWLGKKPDTLLNRKLVIVFWGAVVIVELFIIESIYGDVKWMLDYYDYVASLGLAPVFS